MKAEKIRRAEDLPSGRRPVHGQGVNSGSGGGGREGTQREAGKPEGRGAALLPYRAGDPGEGRGGEGLFRGALRGEEGGSKTGPGQCRIFLDDRPLERLDEEIGEAGKGTFTFVRLTMLSGRLW